jgi:Type IV secretion-system coupling protein DNA-binding domain
MMSVDEQLTKQFYEWELRGRGGNSYDLPILPEPPFAEFAGHYLPSLTIGDDGRRDTVLSRFADAIRVDQGDAIDQQAESTESRQSEPIPFERQDVTEIVLALPHGATVRRDAVEELLFNLSACNEPIAFEIIASAESVRVQFATGLSDAELVKQQVQAYFPACVVTLRINHLANEWRALSAYESSILEFGLEREFMLPLNSRRSDFILAFTAALSELQQNELAVFQTIFQPVRSPWASSILRSVSDEDGKPFFSNRPELLSAAKVKVSRPLYAVVVRIAIVAETFSRRATTARAVSRIIGSLLEPSGNNFVVLESDAYSCGEQEIDLLQRQGRRSGMLLNSDELLLFLNLPSGAVQTPKLLQQATKTRAAPNSVIRDDGLALGDNAHGGSSRTVRLTPDQRVRHIHIIGASGTGKSTLLLNLIRQDIDAGEGVALLDPHGDLADAVIDSIPSNRLNDVVFVDPSDETHAVGFNILSATSDLERTLLASDLISVFQRLSTSWGDQMSSVLQNGILAFLESERGGTLADLRRFLLERGYREEFLTSVRDPEIVYYWQKAFPQLSGNKSIGPILTRLETFLSPKPIRLMVSQKANRLDFREITDTGKIFIGKLAQGLIGRENAYLLGSLFVAKLQQTAMARQSRPEEQRRDFWLYIDEVHNFVTASMAEILAGARKYRLGLTVAHQELRQLARDDTVASAVLSNAFTRIAFRVGDSDARALSDGFAHFDSDDLRRLETGQAICRVERSDYDFNLSIPPADFEFSTGARARREEVIAASRAKYATPRDEVETLLAGPTEKKPQRPSVSEQSTQRPVPVAETNEAAPASVIAPPISAPDFAPAQAVEPHAIAPRPLGKGGEQHKRLQLLIKQWAQGMGYRSTIEEPLTSGGLVDVSLRKPQRTIACEISITTSTANEAENVRKCIDAGYNFVAMLSPDPKRLATLKDAILPALEQSAQAKVRFFSSPDTLFTFIEELDAKDATRHQTVRGYRVKVTHQVVNKASKAERSETIAKIVADVLKRTRP